MRQNGSWVAVGHLCQSVALQVLRHAEAERSGVGEEMPNINQAFPSKFLKAADLGGHEVPVTIKGVQFEPVGQDKEMKPVLYFEGKQRGLVLNKTNANKIIEITGSALTEDWRGHRIKLYPTETQFGGDMVDCIRVRPANGAAMKMTRPAPPPPPPIDFDDDGSAGGEDSDIPF